MPQAETSGVAPAKSDTTGANSLTRAKSRILVNVSSNWAGFIANGVLAFVITPLLVHGLGAIGYGIWSLIGQVTGYMGLLDFGIQIAISRYIAHHHALGEQKEISQVVSSTIAFFSVPTAIISAVGLALAVLFPRLFTIPPEMVSDVRISILLVTASVVVTFLRALFGSCLAAISRYDLLSIRNISWAALRALLLWIFISRGYGLVAVAVINLVVQVVNAWIGYYLVKSQMPWLEIGPKLIDRGVLGKVLHFTYYAFLLSIAKRMKLWTDGLVIGFVLGPVAVTYYMIGSLIADQLRTAMESVASLYAPLAAQMNALNQRDSMRNLFLSGSRVGYMMVLAGAIGVAVLREPFLKLWMGQEFAAESAQVMVLLTFAVAINALSLTCGQILYGMSKHKMNAWLSVGEAGANLVLSIVLIHRMGAVGVAWGTVIPAIIFQAIALPLYTMKLLEVSPSTYYWNVVLRPTLASVPYGLLLWFFVRQGMVRGWLSMGLVLILGLAVFAAMAWTISLEPQERRFAMKMLRPARNAA